MTPEAIEFGVGLAALCVLGVILLAWGIQSLFWAIQVRRAMRARLARIKQWAERKS